MEDEYQEGTFEEESGWKIRTIIVGGIIGALTGVGASYLLVRNAEQHGEKLSITGGQGLKLGVLLAGFLRSLLNLDES